MAGHKPMEKKRKKMMYGSRQPAEGGGMYTMKKKNKKRDAMNAGGIVMASMENQKPV